MSTATLTRPDTDTTTIDKPETPRVCSFIRQSTFESCDRTAVAMIEFHKVGDCKAEECNGRGNMEGNVCAEHLDFFIQMAVDIIKEGEAGILPMFRGRCQIICGTCKMPIHKASDILQKVTRF